MKPEPYPWRCLVPVLWLIVLVVTTRGAVPDLRVAFYPPEAATADIAFVSTAIVDNSGPVTAPDVRFTNSFSADVVVLNAWSDSGACVVSNNIVTCDLGSVQHGYGRAWVQVQAVAPSVGFITNVATVASAEMESAYTNNIARQVLRISREKFFRSGNMLAAAWDHLSVRINGDRVFLINGGPAPDEIFDPAARAFTAVTSSNRLTAYGASSLNDGRVFLCGASKGSAAGQIFDPATGAYSDPVLMPQNFYPYLCVTLLDGTVLIASQLGEPNFTFDPASNTFTTRSNMTMRNAYTLTRLLDGSVLVIGITNAERYLPATGQFVQAATLNHPRYSRSATLLENGRVLVVGDRSYEGIYPAEIYDPVANKFADTAAPRMTLYSFRAAPLPGNRVLFLSTSDAEIYDVASGVFVPTVSPENSREMPSLVALENGAVFVSGGRFFGAATTATEIFDANEIYSLPRIVVDNATIDEGTISTNKARFTVSISPPPTNSITMNLKPVSATADYKDYAPDTIPLTFTTGATSQAALVSIVPDLVYESAEVFTARLENASWGVVARRFGVGTILNDDASPVISVSDAGTYEPNVNWTNMLFTVRLTGTTELPAKVEFFTEAGTAQPGSDFVPTNGALVFLPGNAKTQTVSIRILGDLDPELTETFRLRLTKATDAAIGTPFATGYITNTDGAAGYLDRFEWAAIAPTQHANVPFPITVRAIDGVGNVASNFVGSVIVTATAGAPPGTNLNFDLNTLAPWQPLNAGDAPGPYQLAMFDTDGDGIQSAAFALNPNSGSPDGIQQAVFLEGGRPCQIRASVAISSQPYTYFDDTVSLVLDGVVMTNISTVGQQFVLRTNLITRFTPPESRSYSLAFTFVHRGAENPELFAYLDDVEISATPVAPRKLGPFAKGEWAGSMTISNISPPVRLRADDRDGHFGSSNPFEIAPTVNLSLTPYGSPRSSPLRVGGVLQYNVIVANFGPQTATGIRTTNELPPNVVVLSAHSYGGCTINSNVVICDLPDLPSGFSSSGASIQAMPYSVGWYTNHVTVGSAEFDSVIANNVGIVTNYAAPPTATILNASAMEPDTGITDMMFTLQLSGISSQAVSAAWFTSDGSAQSGSDYVAASGIVEFAPGVTNQTISVAILGDVLIEPNETLRVSITNVTNAVYAPYYASQPYAVGTISNDDFATIDIGDSTVTEGDTGTTNAVFVFTYTKPFVNTTFVSYAVSPLTANAKDFKITTYAVVAVPPRVTNGSIAVAVYGDTVNEPDETFHVRLNGSSARFGRSAGFGTILNDDAVAGRLNSFTISSPASPRFKGYPYGASATAVDYLGTVVSNFTGSVALSALTDSGRVLQLADDFEDGNFDGWTNQPDGAPPLPALLDHGPGSNRFSLIFSNGPREILHSITSPSAPDYVEFSARVSATNTVSGEVYLKSSMYTPVVFAFGSNGVMGLSGSRYSLSDLIGAPYTANRDYRVRIDLFWTKASVNLWVDGIMVATNFYWIDTSWAPIERIDIRNSGSAVAVFDDFRVWKDNQHLALASRPGQIAFANGAWNGDVTVHDIGTNVFLRLDDGLQHIGDSGVFDVVELPLADTNSNAMPDAWERLYFGDLIEASADADGDGSPNVHEFRAGTNPASAASAFGMSLRFVNAASNSISFPTVLGKRYRVQAAPGIPTAQWIDITGDIVGTGEKVTVPLEAWSTEARFYRARLMP